MTSLIFHTEEKQVLVAMDTLATHLNGKPFMFTTKSFIVPHLRMMMCGTGTGGFLGTWLIQVNDRMVVRDIDHLDYHTPRVLASLWHGYKEECSITDDVTTTVYHFGFSQMDGLIHSYAYRSTNGFSSEPLGYGTGVKPKCEVPEPFQLPDDIPKMMRQQREIQAACSKEERIYIGGEIQIFHLTEYGFNAYTLERFDDFDSDERAIYQNFGSS